MVLAVFFDSGGFDLPLFQIRFKAKYPCDYVRQRRCDAYEEDSLDMVALIVRADRNLTTCQICGNECNRPE